MAYKQTEQYDEEITLQLSDCYKKIIKLIGENETREGLLKTPFRAANSIQYLTQGYFLDAKKILNSAKFYEKSEGMVLVKDIEVYSLCEHHLVPFFGKAHIAYLPDSCIVGLSKIARVVDVFARRLQVQENMTKEILDSIQQSLNPLGVAVVIECQHLCMMMRGVGKQNSITKTSSFSGLFKQDEKIRDDFFHLIK